MNNVIDNFDEEWIRREFAKRLRKQMHNEDIIQEELMYATGISRVALSHYMNAKQMPTGYNLCKIAKALNCTVSSLLPDDM